MQMEMFTFAELNLATNELRETLASARLTHGPEFERTVIEIIGAGIKGLINQVAMQEIAWVRAKGIGHQEGARTVKDAVNERLNSMVSVDITVDTKPSVLAQPFFEANEILSSAKSQAAVERANRRIEKFFGDNAVATVSLPDAAVAGMDEMGDIEIKSEAASIKASDVNLGVSPEQAAKIFADLPSLELVSSDDPSITIALDARTTEALDEEQKAVSPTAGMTLEERIKHVGGRTNAAGYVEFGSPMAVNAMFKHLLRDLKVDDTKINIERFKVFDNPMGCGIRSHAGLAYDTSKYCIADGHSYYKFQGPTRVEVGQKVKVACKNSPEVTWDAEVLFIGLMSAEVLADKTAINLQFVCLVDGNYYVDVYDSKNFIIR